MRKLVFFTALICLATLTQAQYQIEFVSAQQNQTISNYELLIGTSWGEIPFPPTNPSWILLLSTRYMGAYPPYRFIVSLPCDAPERYPAFELLTALDPAVVYHGRLFCYSGETVYAKTPEFTFTVGTVTTIYTGQIPWMTTEYGWQGSFGITNTSEDTASVTLTFRYSAGGEHSSVDSTIPPGGVLTRYAPAGWSGTVTIRSSAPGNWTAFYVWGDSVSLSAGSLAPSFE